ncbi:hypothetical protein CSQ85_08945 [Bifidobacterium rousetti]|uniref:hypothetical protein n=1 Tax=Bifidobacterium rousetti TaxID=2045439 RepID=UPI00123B5DBF|nr:hypothetical protein [Bifidobacterium rousetti]KAA8818277.1 hypothetical protein CSQ85_08945 [Bifidobacterium rousetti]
MATVNLPDEHLRVLADAYERYVDTSVDGEHADAADVFDLFAGHDEDRRFAPPKLKDWSDAEIVRACNTYLDRTYTYPAFRTARDLVDKLKDSANRTVFERRPDDTRMPLVDDATIDSAWASGGLIITGGEEPAGTRERERMAGTLDRTLTGLIHERGWDATRLGVDEPGDDPMRRIRAHARMFGRSSVDYRQDDPDAMREEARRHQGDLRGRLILEAYGLEPPTPEADAGAELGVVRDMVSQELDPRFRRTAAAEAARGRLAMAVDERLNAISTADRHAMTLEDANRLTRQAGQRPVILLDQDVRLWNTELAGDIQSDEQPDPKDVMQRAVTLSGLLLEAYGLRPQVEKAEPRDRRVVATMLRDRVDPWIDPELYAAPPVTNGVTHRAWMRDNDPNLIATDPWTDPSAPEFDTRARMARVDDIRAMAWDTPEHAQDMTAVGDAAAYWFTVDAMSAIADLETRGLVDLNPAGNGGVIVSRPDMTDEDPKVRIRITDNQNPDHGPEGASVQASLMCTGEATTLIGRYDEHPDPAVSDIPDGEHLAARTLQSLGLNPEAAMNVTPMRAEEWRQSVEGRLDQVARDNDVDRLLDPGEVALRLPNRGLVGLDQFHELLPDPMLQDRYVVLAPLTPTMAVLWNAAGHWNDADYWKDEAQWTFRPSSLKWMNGCKVTTPAREALRNNPQGHQMPLPDMYPEGAGSTPYEDVHGEPHVLPMPGLTVPPAQDAPTPDMTGGHPNPVDEDPYENPVKAPDPAMPQPTPGPKPAPSTSMGPSLA